MCRVFNSILAVTAIGGLSGAAVASRSASPSIEGVWRTVEITTTGPAARTITAVQPNLSIITAKHYSHMQIDADGTAPGVAGCGEGVGGRAPAGMGTRRSPRPAVTSCRAGAS